MNERILADRLHPYFTASKFFPDDPVKAWENEKAKYVLKLHAEIEAIKKMTVQDYCRVTGSTILSEE